MAHLSFKITAFVCLSCLMAICLLGTSALAADQAADKLASVAKESAGALETPAKDDTKYCIDTLTKVVHADERTRLEKFCAHIQQLPNCTSMEGRPIQHTDITSTDPRAKRILVLGMIHGDEPLAGEMALEWSARLQTLQDQKITARNHWRVIPMLNPDGLERHTRMNSRGVDLNRNFPTKDWADSAVNFWKKEGAGDPRRFPGEAAASESETRCVVQHIKDFKPDFIVSVHTPYRVLDFDGPKIAFPRYKELPWKALGNYPGSLGRYMWKDYQVPVLTIELGQNIVDAAQLQDIIGKFAIEASRVSGRKTASSFDTL